MSDVTDQGNRIEEDGVLNLTGENYEKTISKFDYVLVSFYAPWSSHSVTQDVDFVKAASILCKMESTIKLARVDLTTDGTLAGKLDFRDITTFMFIK